MKKFYMSDTNGFQVINIWDGDVESRFVFDTKVGSLTYTCTDYTYNPKCPRISTVFVQKEDLSVSNFRKFINNPSSFLYTTCFASDENSSEKNFWHYDKEVAEHQLKIICKVYGYDDYETEDLIKECLLGFDKNRGINIGIDPQFRRQIIQNGIKMKDASSFLKEKEYLENTIPSESIGLVLKGPLAKCCEDYIAAREHFREKDNIFLTAEDVLDFYSTDEEHLAIGFDKDAGTQIIYNKNPNGNHEVYKTLGSNINLSRPETFVPKRLIENKIKSLLDHDLEFHYGLGACYALSEGATSAYTLTNKLRQVDFCDWPNFLNNARQHFVYFDTTMARDSLFDVIDVCRFDNSTYCCGLTDIPETRKNELEKQYKEFLNIDEREEEDDLER